MGNSISPRSCWVSNTFTRSRSEGRWYDCDESEKGRWPVETFTYKQLFFLATSFEWAQSWGGDFIRMENNLLFINLLAIYICIYIYAMIYIYIDKYTHTNSRFCCKWIRYGSMMWQFFPTSWQTVLWKNWSPIECVPVCHGLWFS